MATAPYHTRIAPTPSGYLHEGNAFNFVLTWVLARRAGGTVRLRIDDADRDRDHAPFVEDIFRALEWLGLDWDVGPTGPDDFASRWSQQLRYDRYADVIQQYQEAGHLFACACTRKDIRDVSPDLSYPGTCVGRGLPLHTPDANWRLNDSTLAVPYPVLRQKNAAPAYMVVSVVDDVDHGITHIVRGHDLYATSQTQVGMARYVDELSGFREIHIQHHGLIVGPDGEKLSKSQGSTDLRMLQEQGRGPEVIYARVGRALGVTAETLVDLLHAET